MLENLKKEMSRFTSPTGLVHSPKDVNDFNISTVLYLHFWRLLADRGTLVEPTDYDTDTDAAYDFYNEQTQRPADPVGYRGAISLGAWNTRYAKLVITLNGTKNFPLYVHPFLKLRAYSKCNILDQMAWLYGVLVFRDKAHDIPLFLTLSTMKKETGFFAKLGVKYLVKRLTQRYGDVWGIYKDHFGDDFPLKKYTEGAKF